MIHLMDRQQTTMYDDDDDGPPNAHHVATGNVTEGGKPLKEYQHEDPAHNDPGTVASAYPADAVVLAVARKILKGQGS